MQLSLKAPGSHGFGRDHFWAAAVKGWRDVAKVQQLAVVADSHRNGHIPAEVLFGQTDEMQRVRRTIERVAAVRVPVLIRGESGSGRKPSPRTCIASRPGATSRW